MRATTESRQGPRHHDEPIRYFRSLSLIAYSVSAEDPLPLSRGEERERERERGIESSYALPAMHMPTAAHPCVNQKCLPNSIYSSIPPAFMTDNHQSPFINFIRHQISKADRL
eukprot:TRINITY_DN3993_c0_g1_i1.p1 TRINITY_DN3993_c0_g1~~TRINITY_DN3993_c0_g1_i1.p1  ORF type:complete len:113 (-),score=8.43 TRINITY_DN3993_c0_g1_i1:113-451(-)